MNRPTMADMREGWEYHMASFTHISRSRSQSRVSQDVDSVTVAIVNYNTLGLLADCIESLLRFYPQIPLVLVDNDSIDGSREYVSLLADEEQNVKCVLPSENLTHGPALHRGAMEARTPYVFTLDSDTFVLIGGFLEIMLAEFARDPKLFAIGRKLTTNLMGLLPKPPFVHPMMMLMDREKYLKGRKFSCSGHPVRECMADALDRGEHLKDFPVQSYIFHHRGGTRAVEWSKRMRKRRRMVEVND